MSAAAARSPSMVPASANALRTRVGLAVVGVVLSEMYASTQGRDFLLMVGARERGGANRVPAVVPPLFLALLLVNVGLWAAEKRLRARGELDYTDGENP